FPRTAGNLFPVLSYLAIATALYVTIRALAENSPLAARLLSRSASPLAFWPDWRVALQKESRAPWCTGSWSQSPPWVFWGFCGFWRSALAKPRREPSPCLVEHAPRLAVSFAIFGLALVGLPGTLSFCSEDLLIHGTLMSHPLPGLFLSIATAMNAVSVFRL